MKRLEVFVLTSFGQIYRTWRHNHKTPYVKDVVNQGHPAHDKGNSILTNVLPIKFGRTMNKWYRYTGGSCPPPTGVYRSLHNSGGT